MQEFDRTMISSANLSGLVLLGAITLTSFAKQTVCTRFHLDDWSYNCSSSLICLGDAHQYEINGDGFTNGNSDGSFAGKLSLVAASDVYYRDKSGVAYYREPIRMLDRTTKFAISFNSTFSFAQIPEYWNQTTNNYRAGDGMTFLFNSDNSTRGHPSSSFGIFDKSGNNVTEKSVVVEFDNYDNGWDTRFRNDIGRNHVAFDIGNEYSVTSQLADKVDIQLYQNSTVHAWVEYSADTQQLELRISSTTTKPLRPLIWYTLNLFEAVEEYMWVGFSASTGGQWSNYYVWNWTFESNFTTPPSSLSRDRRKIRIGLSVGIPVSVILIGGCCLLVLARKRLLSRRAWEQPEAVELGRKLACMTEGCRFSYKQLSKATGGFAENAKLGKGGFGSVYRGVLPPLDTPVAVKRLNAESSQGEKEFMVEISTVSQLRHRNLIQLLGWCEDRGRFMIVYELMPNGSLDQVLFHPSSVTLSWSRRYNILRGTAAAVDYLHQGWKQRVIHRDIKASNIMLDDEWDAKLGDFGLARLVDYMRTPATTGVAGTWGYIAPEAASGKFTEQTDTFAFGMVALEVATGRRSVALHLPEDEIGLLDWVWRRLSEGRLLSVVDERLGDDYDVHSMEMVLRIGLLCCNPNPSARPHMRQVVQALEGDGPLPPFPASKPALCVDIESSHSTIFSTRSNLSIRDSKKLTRTSSRKSLEAVSGRFHESRAISNSDGDIVPALSWNTSPRQSCTSSRYSTELFMSLS